MSKTAERWALAGTAAVAGAVIGVASLRARRARDNRCPARGTRLLFIGDSHAVGLQGQIAKLATECRVNTSISAIGGSNISTWQASKMDPLLEQARPDVVLVSLGTNSFGRNDPDKVKQQIGAFLKRARAAGARVFWIEPIRVPFKDQIGVTAMWRQRVGRLDRYPSRELELERSFDNIHLTPAGYAKWATAVWRRMSGRTRVN